VNTLDDVRAQVLDRTPFEAARRWVATYFVAALRPSAIGLLGAFGQKPDQRS
jgi:hypothetical protein